MQMTRLTLRQHLLNFFLEKDLGRKDSEAWADALTDKLAPAEWEEGLELESCYSCGGKGHIIIRVEHPKSNSASSYNTLCGRCFGTGKLPEVKQEYN